MMKFRVYFYFILFSCSFGNSCFCDPITTLLMKDGGVEDLSGQNNLVGHLMNGQMNGSINIPLVLDLLQGESDWIRSEQKEKPRKNKITPYKINNFDTVTRKSQFDRELGHRTKSEKDILKELKQSLGLMMKKSDYDTKPKTPWKIKPIEPKNERLGEIDVTEANEYSDTDEDDVKDSIETDDGNDENLQYGEKLKVFNPKYTTEQHYTRSTKHFQNVNNKIEIEEDIPFPKTLRNNINSETKRQKLKSHSSLQRKHHDSLLSLDSIYQVLDELASNMRHEKQILDDTEEEDDGPSKIIDENRGEQMILKNLKKYIGLIALKDRLGNEQEPVSLVESDNVDTEGIHEKESNKFDAKKFIDLEQQTEKDEKLADNFETQEIDNYFRNSTNHLNGFKSSASEVCNLSKDIIDTSIVDSPQLSINPNLLIDIDTNLRNNQDTGDGLDLDQNSHNFITRDVKRADLSNYEIHEINSDYNKRQAHNLQAPIESVVSLSEESQFYKNDADNGNEQSIRLGNAIESSNNRNFKNDQQIELEPTASLESSFTSDGNSITGMQKNKNMWESPLHTLNSPFSNGVDSQVNERLIGDERRWELKPPSLISDMYEGV